MIYDALPFLHPIYIYVLPFLFYLIFFHLCFGLSNPSFGLDLVISLLSTPLMIIHTCSRLLKASIYLSNSLKRLYIFIYITAYFFTLYFLLDLILYSELLLPSYIIYIRTIYDRDPRFGLYVFIACI